MQIKTTSRFCLMAVIKKTSDSRVWWQKWVP
ncbi:rCG50676 [Rattus norvegicus]|uniref:RCG50676 n=1 Tax=Rattus norvegicus TaxID=10116 RepID=A6KC63_RAT|nr:rCG50676 [Rattus norvegicus]